MRVSKLSVRPLLAVRVLCVIAAGPLLAISLCGCLVAGVSSNGGAFIWPGGLGMLVILALIFFLLRRRR